MHGYSNAYAEMRPAFIASGPAFKHGYRIENDVQNIDIYPLLLHLLNVPTNDLAFNGTFDRIEHILADYPDYQKNTDDTLSDIVHGRLLPITLVIISCAYILRRFS
jgi:phosphoglycerol transferase MdoB-like AlkP superfamily enzyme